MQEKEEEKNKLAANGDVAFLGSQGLFLGKSAGPTLYLIP